MRSRPHSRLRLAVVAAAAMLVAATSGLSAQQVLTPEPLDASAPTAQRARAVAELVLAGDTAALASFVKEHGAPAFAGSESLAQELAAAVESVRGGVRTIVRVDGLGAAGVGIALGAAEGSPPERAIVVGLEPEAPHRITGLRVVAITMGGAGGGR